MNINYYWIVALAFVAVVINASFFYYVSFHLDSRKKILIETGTAVQSQFKEVNYNQGKKWNEYRVISTWIDPASSIGHTFTSDWIRGTPPKKFPEIFKVYIDKADATNYYVDVKDLKKSFFNRSITTLAVAVAVILAAAFFIK